MSTVPKRQEVPIPYTWNAATVFPTDEAWEAAIATLESQLRPRPHTRTISMKMPLLWQTPWKRSNKPPATSTKSSSMP